MDCAAMMPTGFAQFDQRAGGEVAAVAVDANAVLAFAGEHGADLDLFDAGGVDGLGLDFVNFLVGLDETFLRVRAG